MDGPLSEGINLITLDYYLQTSKEFLVLASDKLIPIQFLGLFLERSTQKHQNCNSLSFFSFSQMVTSMLYIVLQLLFCNNKKKERIEKKKETFSIDLKTFSSFEGKRWQVAQDPFPCSPMIVFVNCKLERGHAELLRINSI